MRGSGEPPTVTAAMVARSRALSSTRFSPDGRRLAWIETVAGRADIVAAPADGSGPPVVVTTDAAASPFGGFTWAGGEGGRGDGGVPHLGFAASRGRLGGRAASGGG